ncbi:WD repeat-containing protein 48 homolog [Papaver somniferum]|uniref:WD repeat-containing protein 48 homolog n=1 Tax=Papaver somniferum TaxID=3469 RepID=UPI000E6F4E21|nr:WD repeat-containing protein 48 homolog [Papaver somniferum]XP_026399883.1 WD repeat-containing protein 48 homolog [Papaver somniferum]XP_026399884.1 WD repeat-containing protein 48 homolog [Papaver somniferum]
MEIGEVVKNTNRNNNSSLYNNNNNNCNHRSSPLRQQQHSTEAPTTSSSPVFELQWGNRKRLRCSSKPHNKITTAAPDSTVERTSSLRADRRLVRADRNSNFRRPFSPHQPHPPSTSSHRILRNSESSTAAAAAVMKGGHHHHHQNGVSAAVSPERGGEEVKLHHHQDKKGNRHHDHHHSNNNHHRYTNGVSGSSETADENHNKKVNGGGGGGSSSGGSGDQMMNIPPVWPPKFVIALTNKEKEEDFMAIKGSKLPQRPKKRAKFVQRTLNLVSPGTWLCDLTLERYEVREKKTTKKRPRGLKAMGNMESDSE